VVTMPCERYRAVLRTEEFLKDIMKGKYDDNLNDLFYEARCCLKHFPSEYDMEKAAENCDLFDDVDFNGVKIKW
jgi:hypothetical protein